MAVHDLRCSVRSAGWHEVDAGQVDRLAFDHDCVLGVERQVVMTVERRLLRVVGSNLRARCAGRFFFA
jgi:hypothetical protein